MHRSAATPLAVLLFLTTVFYLNFFSRIIFAPLLPAIEKDLSLSHGAAGSLFLVLSCGYFFSLAGSGHLSAKLGHRNTIVLSLLAVGASLLLIASAGTFPALQAAFVLLGMASGLYLPSGIATISALFSRQRWGRVFAVHELAPNLAFLTAPLAASCLLPRTGWQQITLLPAAAAFTAAILYPFFCRQEDLYGKPPNLANCSAILLQRNFILLTLFFAMGIAGTIGVYNLLPLYLVTVHSFAPEDANLYVGLSRMATLGSALAGGWIADRFGSRKTIGGVLLLTGLCTAGISLAGKTVLLFCIFLQPLLAVCFFPAGFALLSKLGAPEVRNVVISLAIPLAFVAGAGLLPALAARMADAGHFGGGVFLMGIFIGSGTLLIPLLHPDRD
jgi:NNP family nitrate/nitrite transporter-like MFS transporter